MNFTTLQWGEGDEVQTETAQRDTFPKVSNFFPIKVFQNSHYGTLDHIYDLNLLNYIYIFYISYITITLQPFQYYKVCTVISQLRNSVSSSQISSYIFLLILTCWSLNAFPGWRSPAKYYNSAASFIVITVTSLVSRVASSHLVFLIIFSVWSGSHPAQQIILTDGLVFRMLQDSRDNGTINIDCVDPLGRTALLMAIDNENLEMVEVLLENKVETKDALLHAINEEFVEAVEVLLDHEETIHQEGEPWVSWPL